MNSHASLPRQPLSPAPHRKAALACCALALTALCGCGARHAGKSSQVVATVNEQEITILQLNQMLRGAGHANVTPDLRKKALESLTNEELLVQAAMKMDIDRDPAFVQALEHARRTLLAQLFAERVVYPKEAVTAAEVTEFYRNMPLLFANRRVFRLTTFLTDEVDITPRVTDELSQAESVDLVRNVLDAHGIKHVTQMVSVAPEEIPVHELPAYAKARVGDVFFTRKEDGKMLLMAVAAIQEELPLSLEVARPRIEQYLRNARNRQATEEYLKGARSTAKIVYAEAPAPAEPPAEAPTPTAMVGTP